jgi:hypothetical protein
MGERHVLKKLLLKMKYCRNFRWHGMWPLFYVTFYDTQ